MFDKYSRYLPNICTVSTTYNVPGLFYFILLHLLLLFICNQKEQKMLSNSGQFFPVSVFDFAFLTPLFFLFLSHFSAPLCSHFVSVIRAIGCLCTHTELNWTASVSENVFVRVCFLFHFHDYPFCGPDQKVQIENILVVFCQLCGWWVMRRHWLSLCQTV